MFTELEVHNKLGVIFLKRKPTNSLNLDFLTEIYEKIIALDEDDSITMIVLFSRLRFGFSSGLDLGSFFSPDRKEFRGNIYSAVYQVYRINYRIVSSSKVFIAALTGPVIGSSVSIALACDIRIATEDTWFWIPDPQYGGLLADGGIELLSSALGRSGAAMLVLTNDRIDIQKMKDLGLVYKTASKEKLYETAVALAEKMIRYSSLTLEYSKKILNHQILSSFRKDELLKVLSSELTFKKIKQYIN